MGTYMHTLACAVISTFDAKQVHEQSQLALISLAVEIPIVRVCVQVHLKN